MISSEMNMKVGQNCASYKPRFGIPIVSMGDSAESCDSCTNFKMGKCSKELFDDIMEMIRLN